MIRSFGDKETEKVFRQEFSRKLPHSIQDRALIKLMILDAAEKEEDLLSPPGNQFEHLRGDLSGFSSIRINNQWRIIFKFRNGEAFDVSITDYH